ncbi:MAG TPA: hypothetical protein VHV82_02560 [Sporichthyaceae bacterium]|jgi:hypothetical protein|nr:hypothetical protein [Sporichthyaceae bacterium]
MNSAPLTPAELTALAGRNTDDHDLTRVIEELHAARLRVRELTAEHAALLGQLIAAEDDRELLCAYVDRAQGRHEYDGDQWGCRTYLHHGARCGHQADNDWHTLTKSRLAELRTEMQEERP